MNLLARVVSVVFLAWFVVVIFFARFVVIARLVVMNLLARVVSVVFLAWFVVMSVLSSISMAVVFSQMFAPMVVMNLIPSVKSTTIRMMSNLDTFRIFNQTTLPSVVGINKRSSIKRFGTILTSIYRYCTFTWTISIPTLPRTNRSLNTIRCITFNRHSCAFLIAFSFGHNVGQSQSDNRQEQGTATTKKHVEQSPKKQANWKMNPTTIDASISCLF